MKKCPKCSYIRKPTDLAPPYECPQCGIIYAKFQKFQEDSRKNGIKTTQSSTDNENNKKRNLTLIIASIVIVSIIIYLLISKQKDNPSQVAQQHAKTILNHDIVSEANDPSSDALIIRPDETKNITISSIFPIMHIDDCWFNLSTKYKVDMNEWEKAGVTVTVDSLETSSLSKSVWEAQNESGHWYPIGFPDTGIHKLGLTTIRYDKRYTDTEFIKNLAKVYVVSNIEAFLKYQELSENDFLNHSSIKWRNFDSVRKTEYTFYQITLHLTIFSPDTSKFARDIGIINITANDFSLGEIHASAISHWGHLHLERITKGNGLKISMGNNWTIQ